MNCCSVLSDSFSFLFFRFFCMGLFKLNNSYFKGFVLAFSHKSCLIIDPQKWILKGELVSGLSYSNESPCSLMIKEFCRGKAGWNDRAIFIETESWPLRPDQKGTFSDIIKCMEKAMPKCFALCPIRTHSLIGDLPRHPLFFLWGPF